MTQKPPVHAPLDRQPPLITGATALMDRLRYPQKFVLISLLFLLPLGLLLYFFSSELQERIAFTRREGDGIAYLRPLRRLLEHSAESYHLTRAYLAGNPAVKPSGLRVIESNSPAKRECIGLRRGRE